MEIGFVRIAFGPKVLDQEISQHNGQDIQIDGKIQVMLVFGAQELEDKGTGQGQNDDDKDTIMDERQKFIRRSQIVELYQKIEPRAEQIEDGNRKTGQKLIHQIRLEGTQILSGQDIDHRGKEDGLDEMQDGKPAGLL